MEESRWIADEDYSSLGSQNGAYLVDVTDKESTRECAKGIDQGQPVKWDIVQKSREIPGTRGPIWRIPLSSSSFPRNPLRSSLFSLSLSLRWTDRHDLRRMYIHSSANCTAEERNQTPWSQTTGIRQEGGGLYILVCIHNQQSTNSSFVQIYLWCCPFLLNSSYSYSSYFLLTMRRKKYPNYFLLLFFFLLLQGK